MWFSSITRITCDECGIPEVGVGTGVGVGAGVGVGVGVGEGVGVGVGLGEGVGVGDVGVVVGVVDEVGAVVVVVGCAVPPQPVTINPAADKVPITIILHKGDWGNCIEPPKNFVEAKQASTLLISGGLLRNSPKEYRKQP